MERIRQFMRDKPWAGWIVAILAIGAATVIIVRQNQAQGRFTPASMQEYVTIKYMDTGDEERIPRGRVDKMLREQNSGKLDPSQGLTNPKTGQPTGFIIDKEDWEAWIKRINEDRERLGSDKAKPVPNQPGRPPRVVEGAPPAPTPPPAPKPGN